jgi:hypothetical protein
MYEFISENHQLNLKFGMPFNELKEILEGIKKSIPILEKDIANTLQVYMEREKEEKNLMKILYGRQRTEGNGMITLGELFHDLFLRPA